MTIMGLVFGIILGIIAGIGRYNGLENKDDIWPAFRRGIKTFFLLLFIGIVIDWTAKVYTDYLWYKELGYQSVWTTRFILANALTLAGFVISFIIVHPNVKSAWKSVSSIIVEDIRREDYRRRDTKKDDLGKVIGSVMKWVVVSMAFCFGLYAWGGWDQILQYIYATPFEVVDPVHNLDVSFYVFEIPFYQWLLGYFFWVVFLTLVAVVVMYGIAYLINKEEPVLKGGYAHASVLTAFLFFLWAVGTYLERYTMLTKSHARLFGANYVDVNVMLPALGVMTVFLVLAGFVLLVNAFIRSWKVIAYTLGVLALVGFCFTIAWPVAVQVFYVSPTESSIEAPYIAQYIEFSKKAYDLKKYDEKEFNFNSSIKPEDFKANDAMLSLARTMDWRPLLEANDTLQEIRTYYDFNDVDVDRYNRRLGMVSVREINTEQLPQQAKTWPNIHLQYTHGEGYTIADVNRVESQGLPAFIVKDIPPKGPVQTKHNEVYFGELTTNWVVVNTTLDEFGQPAGAGAEYERYQGSAGIKLGTLERLAFTLRFGDLQILLNGNIKPDSRMMFDRSISDRVKTVGNMFTWDKDPYAVIAPDRIYWMWDGYVTAFGYPYADPDGDKNYIRNSVKAVVDAFEGKTTFYVTDPQEPIIRVWMSVFPDLFKPMSEMPKELREHVRYPEDLFTIQAKKLMLFHMSDSINFYNREDLWAIPNEAYLDKPVPMDPRYVWMRLPGETTEEFVMIQPFTPSNKQNLVGWLGVRMDGDKYGQMKLWLFPRDQNVIGPSQVEGLINQDPAMSRDITLWSQRGSKILWGNLIALPILGQNNGTVVYIKPLFLVADQGKIPALTRVIVYANDRLIVGATLAEALQDLYSGKGTTATPSVQPTTSTPSMVPPVVSGTPQSKDALIKAANAYYEAAVACAGKGDMACFGAQMQELGKVLKQLETTK